MRVKTTRFAEIEVSDDKMLRFPEGLIGFESCTRFALISRGDSLFMWLQSLDDPALAFVVTDPSAFVPGYKPEIDRDSLRTLGVESPSDLKYLSIAVVPADPSRTTINLRAPIAVNHGNRVAVQVVTLNPDNPLKFRVFDRGGARGDSACPDSGEGTSC
ncbi:MAG: flagellar assembly protein FliW [Firmicutes bacterium]|nr:flagellar assembly protein FliW [Bacillota bacterium]